MAILSVSLCSVAARAVTVRIDYTYDTSSASPFFPVGSQARATVEAVAAFYSGILEDTLSSIQTPPKFQGSLGGEVTWNWAQRFNNPVSGSLTVVPNPVVPADEYTIYVGGRNYAGNVLGTGGPGGYTPPIANSSGGFTSQEITQLEAIHEDFVGDVTRRQKETGFAAWGGVFSVDTTLGTGLFWHLNHTVPPPNSNYVDLYSVAVHEIGHALGFGIIASSGGETVWQSLLSDDSTHFMGATAVNAFGNDVLLNEDSDHWANGTASKTFSGFVNQEAAFDPSLTNGTRKHLTLLDAAALVDLGWEIDLPAPPTVLAGDFNNDGRVDALDYTVWRNNLNDSTEADINFAGNGGGVTAADYTYWKVRYGNVASGSGGIVGIVPEPGVVALVGLAVLIGIWPARSAARRG